MIKRSRVRVPAAVGSFSVKLKRPKINKTEAGEGAFKKIGLDAELI